MTHSCSCSPDISSPMLSLPGPFSGRSLDSWGSSMLAPSGNSKWWPPRGEWIDLGTSGHCGRGHTRFCAFLLVHRHIKKYIVLPFSMHIFVYIYIYIYIYVCMYICIYMRINIYVCTCALIYIYMYVCIYICVYCTKTTKNMCILCICIYYDMLYSYNSESDEHTIIYIHIYSSIAHRCR